MGFAPGEVDEMSFGQIRAAAAGFAKANGGGGPRPPTDEEFERAKALAG
jgi:hypothetical protein